MPKKRRKAEARKPRRMFAIMRALLLQLVLLAAMAGVGYVLWIDHQITQTFTGWNWQLPARVYARALELYAGFDISRSNVEDELLRLGYRKVATLSGPGEFTSGKTSIELHTRGFAFWDNRESPQRCRITFKGARGIASIENDPGGTAVALLRLEPMQIARIYPTHNEDRVLVRLSEVPHELIDALIATEDRRFYQHYGVDPLGIARAMLANLRHWRFDQGGSTITQQLVKNYILGHQRTLVRKIPEMAMALSLERHYTKDQILEAYLNEIFLGQDGTRSIHGFGLAAEFYFGRPLNELALPELAMLVGLAKGASYYDPRRAPERARSRRNVVLSLMAEQGKINAATAEHAQQAPLNVIAKPLFTGTRYPAFVELVRRQLHQDYRDEDLQREGLQIFTTLDPIMQATAEHAVDEQISKLEKNNPKQQGMLQAAVVVSDHQTGEIIALIGDRQAQYSGFNRALDAHRPVGSLLKPAVYLTALQQPDRYAVNTILDDESISIDLAGKTWIPDNYDNVAHGPVQLQVALAHSYNLATVQLGMALGVPEVIKTLRALGIEESLPPYPSLFLGAADLSPMDMARMYQTIAARGFRTPMRAIREVLTHDGKRLQHYELKTTAALEPRPVYLLTYILNEVTQFGTAASLSNWLSKDRVVAGKTGTTNDLRDSWFAGFSEDINTVAWIGRDDNAPINLTGAQGAMRIWAQLMADANVQSLQLNPPDGIEWRWVDFESGAVTRSGCPGSRSTPFISPAPVAGTLDCPTPLSSPAPENHYVPVR
ncbi:MAG: penicillin-binding protein 1B [Gammaproteobacteria bacterium]